MHTNTILNNIISIFNTNQYSFALYTLSKLTLYDLCEHVIMKEERWWWAVWNRFINAYPHSSLVYGLHQKYNITNIWDKTYWKSLLVFHKNST